MSSDKPPKDKHRRVWLIFFTLGLGTLLPWNFFMNATNYFTFRLRDTEPGNETFISSNSTEETIQNHYQAVFSNVMTICAMVPLLVFSCLNTILQKRCPQKVRVMGSLGVILVTFMVTAVLVRVDMDPLTFFVITMVKIIIINSSGAVLQSSLFGMASTLPTSYTATIMSGQGLAGTLAAVSMICAIASGSELGEIAFGYFIFACVVILIAIASFVVLPKMEFYQFYQKSRDNGEESRPDESQPLNATRQPPPHGGTNPSLMSILKKIGVMAFSVWLAFTVTIGVFPAVTMAVKSTVADGGLWEKFFIPVCCFLTFNLLDFAGRSLSAVCLWPGQDSKLLPALVLIRVAFVPFFMMCNVQPRHSMPVIFHHDACFILLMIVFAFSNGYLTSLCMCYGPKKVDPHEAETAGTIMAFFLSLGLACGAALSCLFRKVI
ncbi:equilibrative nucleoside transporter 1-like isoform X2 [Denticeps clupeoides]|nr:equilibrative nucleoside transporter 1-like isoform X2 [Denticeps clupeoides]